MNGSDMPMKVFSLRAPAAVLLLCIATPAVAQDSVEQFYRGKSINIYVGSSAGGGYDSYARIVGRYISKYIPGNPTIVPQNMPGAGGNKAAGYAYSVAPKDGTAIGAIFPGSILQPLIGDTAVQHDPAKFIYLGSANSDVYTCVVRTDAPVKTFKDVLTREMIVGASNEGGTSRDMPTVSNNVLGAKFRIVTGYAGTQEIALAVERNEVHGICGLGYTSLLTIRPDWVERGVVSILVQENVKGSAVLNQMGVPRTVDFAKTAEDRQVLELVYSQGVFGRPYVFPPGVPADRVAALRKAFMAALQDKELLAEAARMKLDIEAISGADVQSMVAKLFATPANIVDRAKQSLVYKAPSK
jgi:tripartite-type tricarboxylate transporter receptor subunit TctC